MDQTTTISQLRDEIKQLNAAKEQFQLAQDAVREGMDVALGSGCSVSDFYTKAEWSLLVRAIEGLERAQYHVAIRMSYLGADPEAAPKADK